MPRSKESPSSEREPSFASRCSRPVRQPTPTRLPSRARPPWTGTRRALLGLPRPWPDQTRFARFIVATINALSSGKYSRQRLASARMIPRIASGRMLPNWVVASAEMLPLNRSVIIASPLLRRRYGHKDDAHGPCRPDERDPTTVSIGDKQREAQDLGRIHCNHRISPEIGDPGAERATDHQAPPDTHSTLAL